MNEENDMESIDEVAESLSVVLVEPRGAGNIGSTARAMRNTGLRNLVLINPCDYLNHEGYSMACKAQDVLNEARVWPTLESYLEEAGKTGLVTVGFTRRVGKVRGPVEYLADSAPVILGFARKTPVALVFGREDKGLRNDELPLCDMLVEIPTHPDYPSVNLSHAVFTALHSLFTAAAAGRASHGHAVEAAPREKLDEMYSHLERTLRRLDYGERGGDYLLRTIMRNMRRIFGRTALVDKELRMLRGIFTQIEKRAVSLEDVNKGKREKACR